MSAVNPQDQIEELKSALGVKSIDNPLRLPPKPLGFFNLLMKRDGVSPETIYATIYSDKPDADRPSIEVLRAYASMLKKGLEAYGVALVYDRAVTQWRIPQMDKKKLQETMEMIRRGEMEPLKFRHINPNPVARLVAPQLPKKFEIEVGDIEWNVPAPVGHRAIVDYKFKDMVRPGASVRVKGVKKSTVWSAIKTFRNSEGGKYKNWMFTVRDVIEYEEVYVRVWRKA